LFLVPPHTIASKVTQDPVIRISSTRGLKRSKGSHISEQTARYSEGMKMSGGRAAIPLHDRSGGLNGSVEHGQIARIDEGTENGRYVGC
jgi:hypothetical protein